MTDEKTLDLMEVDPFEYAASIGHAAAGQLFYVLSGRSKAFDGDWIGCDPSEEEELSQKIYELANYVAERDAGGARLWQKARIDGIVVEDLPESLQFVDAPLTRQWAFDMFATVSLHAYLQISRTQKAAADARIAAKLDSVPLKLEDSIFARTQPLDYMEPHARQFLADQPAVEAEIERRRQALEQLQEDEAGDDVGLPLNVVTHSGPDKPPAISIGQLPEDTNAQDAADQGQDEGDPESADPDAQGEISEVADSGHDELAAELPASVQPQDIEAAELEAPVEDAAGDDGAADNDQPAAVKPSKSKSPN